MDIYTITDHIIKEAISKEDNKILMKSNGFDEKYTNSYMDGYIGAYGDLLNIIYIKNKDSEDLLDEISKLVTDPDRIVPGTILYFKDKSKFYLSKLYIVYEKEWNIENKDFSISMFTLSPIIIAKGNYKEKYEIDFNELEKIFDVFSFDKYCIDLDVLTPYINKEYKELEKDLGNFAIIGKLSEESFSKLKSTKEKYDKNLESTYDDLFKEAYALDEKEN